MSAPGTSLQKLRKIKENGVKAAQSSINQALATEESQLSFHYLIAAAKKREQAALEKLNPKYKAMILNAGFLNLNEIITQIDNEFNFKELLPGGAIEQYLQDQGYNLEAKGSAQKKSEADQQQSLVLPLPEKEQQQVLSHITEKFKQEIVSTIFVEGNNVRQLYKPLIDAAGPYFQQLLNGRISATGLSLDNIDLGSLTIKINTNKMTIKMQKIKKPNGAPSGKIGIDLGSFSISSAGEFFEHMAPVAQRLLYAIMQDEQANLENNQHLIDYINKYNSSATTQYMQDLTVEQTMSVIQQALSEKCPAAITAFNLYGTLIAYKGARSNVRGGLGELRTLCIIEKLFPGQQYSAEGLSKIVVGSSSEKESPVDVAMTILGENLKIGFQSKNTQTNIYSWSISKSDSMDMPSFYSQRLNQGLNGAEEKFFNTYSYNQPVSPYGDYIEEWNDFTNNPAFIGKFNALAYKIIRQEIKDVSEVSFINDFFFMNDKIVLSSTILEQMMYATIDSQMLNHSGTKSSSSDGSLTTSFNYEANKNLVWTEEHGYDDFGNPIFSAGSASNVIINQINYLHLF